MLNLALLGNVGIFASILALAALGGLLSERSGIANIALEGKMLAAACVAAVVSSASGSPILGIFAGILASVILGYCHFAMTQLYRMDHIVSGMVINLFAFGGANFLVLLPQFSGIKANLPKVDVFIGIAFLMAIFCWWLITKTRFGLRLQASGSDPEKARQNGIEPVNVRLYALLGSGAFAGLAGCMILSNSGIFTDTMTAGRGYIALAALILGGWRPIQTVLACLAFAVFEALQIQLQGTGIGGVELPAALWTSLPYLITLIALAGYAGRNRTPAGLGKA
jgi:general nucleoside transport system permease protein